MISFPYNILFLLVLSAFNPDLIFPVRAYNCEVTLINGSTNQALTAHCLANGTDVGTTTLDPAGFVSFLTPVAGDQRTVATCDLTLGNLHGRFDVFDSNEDRSRCSVRALSWRIDESGLYVFVDQQCTSAGRLQGSGKPPVIHITSAVGGNNLPKISLRIKAGGNLKGSAELSSGQEYQISVDVNDVYYASAVYGLKFASFHAYEAGRDKRHADVYWRADNLGFAVSYDKTKWEKQNIIKIVPPTISIRKSHTNYIHHNKQRIIYGFKTVANFPSDHHHLGFYPSLLCTITSSAQRRSPARDLFQERRSPTGTASSVKKRTIVLKSGDAGQVKTDVDAVYHAKARFGFKFTEFPAYYPGRDRGHAAIYWRADNGGFDFSYDNKSNWKRGATWKYSDL
ncbi:hypothetical protein Sango_0610700 [Sesamum angolense]|uniref:Uncharacterized protein n=1 Tax=Sesamum angolense TaxID=2727404 RepID=A0AAE1X666_9LAMI|nr:hypothetical protein Sango_0610700 [Sesamum angolense]